MKIYKIEIDAQITALCERRLFFAEKDRTAALRAWYSPRRVSMRLRVNDEGRGAALETKRPDGRYCDVCALRYEPTARFASARLREETE